ncbi:hypothetical protein FPV67DRAFT_1779352 [Lyophyllum atratum]|nr:hypothetical protein FPV67DRAFT_1779352 [Lyophyllum atratum]
MSILLVRSVKASLPNEPGLGLAIDKGYPNHSVILDFSRPFSTVDSPVFFGPHALGFPLLEVTALTSTANVYNFDKGVVPPPHPPLFCHIHDVAHAHLASLNVPKARSNVQDERFLIGGGFMFRQDTLKYLHDNRPELKARLPPLDAQITPFPGPVTTIDTTSGKEKLGLLEKERWRIDGSLEAENSRGVEKAMRAQSLTDDDILKEYIFNTV